MILGQGIAVPDIRVLHAMQQHVHAADAKHGVVEIKPMKHLMVKMLLLPGIVQDGRMLFP